MPWACSRKRWGALDSLVIQTALQHHVPAGDALAVNREGFGQAITTALREHPCIEVVCEEMSALPDDPAHPVIVATGPLTGAALTQSIGEATSAERMYFYDAIAPIISGDSIDRSIAFAASRYDKGEGADYLNCPMDAAQYAAFLDALRTAESMPLHSFEEPKYFQGCLPVEVIAARGEDALRFGPMKPVGLTDPRTGRWPHAVVQLRQEDRGGQAYNLVGFQTKLKYPEQKRILRMIPGLEQAEFLRLGAIHRNTYLDSPALLDTRMRLRARPHVRFAGQNHRRGRICRKRRSRHARGDAVVGRHAARQHTCTAARMRAWSPLEPRQRYAPHRWPAPRAAKCELVNVSIATGGNAQACGQSMARGTRPTGARYVAGAAGDRQRGGLTRPPHRETDLVRPPIA